MNQWELKTWRLGLGLTQKQAAEALGCSKSWVSSAEIGRRPIPKTIELLCQQLQKNKKRMRRVGR